MPKFEVAAQGPNNYTIDVVARPGPDERLWVTGYMRISPAAAPEPAQLEYLKGIAGVDLVPWMQGGKASIMFYGLDSDPRPSAPADSPASRQERLHLTVQHLITELGWLASRELFEQSFDS